jgi:hypothetical protein
MNINIKTIPHNEQRYETVGDYWWENGNLEIRVSNLGNQDMEYLVAEHELKEAYLCEKRNIKEPDIMDFDIKFNESGKEGEPGDDKNAPYRKEHFFATNIERLVAAELGINWQEYDEIIERIFE